ncbi:dihydroorotate dehydrogenase [Oceaniglobus indicus]|uniref:dihydroorotate dehydrogenase n=1 Tax=Oceaniglobus indicus TaxID=2047749 RepID=UPI000C175E7B|nr:dihydroorotate dehydrogenase [Oceaniglobus indicus]
MNDAKDDHTDAGLDALFENARRSAPAMSDDLFARIMADAVAATPARVAAARRVSPWGRVLGALGGWPSLAGLSAAALAGVWIGIAQPAAFIAVQSGLGFEGAAVASYELEDLMPGFDSLSAEG